LCSEFAIQQCAGPFMCSCTPAVPCPVSDRKTQGAAAPSLEKGVGTAGFESDVDCWLEQKLAADREAFVLALKKKVSLHLADHHPALAEKVEAELLSGLTAARLLTPLAAGKGPEARDAPEAARPSCSWAWPRKLAGPDGEPQRPATALPVVAAQVCSAPADAREGGADAREGGADVFQPPMPETSGSGTAGTSTRSRSNYKSKSVNTFAEISSSAELNNSHSEPVLARLIRRPSFEVFCSTIILVNLAVMAAEVQYQGRSLGCTMGHPDCVAAQPWVDDAFRILHVCFLTAFIIELLLRLAAMRLKALSSGWMLLDAALLAIGVADVMNRLGSKVYFALNPVMMRTARLARMLRLLRMLGLKGRMIREWFTSLFLMLKSIQASVKVLVWFFLLLILLVTCVGMLMNQQVYGYLSDSSRAAAERREVFEYFGTYTRTLITMFEITLGNWAPPSRKLMGNVAEWWGLFIVVYRCFICFAIVNVTRAVFIAETNRLAAGDDAVVAMRKERASRATALKLEGLFHELDDSGDGTLSLEEFQSLISDGILREFLTSMDFEIGDLEELFMLLDNGRDQVGIHEFTHGINMIKGQAKNIDLLTLLKLVRRMDDKIDKLNCVGQAPRLDEALKAVFARSR